MIINIVLFFVAGNRRSFLEGWIHVTVHPIILSCAAVVALATLGDKWNFFLSVKLKDLQSCAYKLEQAICHTYRGEFYLQKTRAISNFSSQGC